MLFFRSPNIQKMSSERDYDGLARCLEYRDSVVRLEAALALAELDDGRGWRYLLEVVRHPEDADSQAAAAEMLGDLGHPRAIPVLKEALPAARGSARQAIEEALGSLGAEDQEHERRPLIPVTQQERLPEAESVLSTLLGGMEGEASLADMNPAVLPDTAIEILSAQQHLDNAAQLRENELQERGLVECMIALWLQPNWPYAWYLRGVLMEDLEREREAMISYRQALALDPSLQEAKEALEELQENLGPLPRHTEEMMNELTSGDWRERRDGAASLGEWLAGVERKSGMAYEQSIDALIETLVDPEREVRHAGMMALGWAGSGRAVPALLVQQESSWLLRFSILQALSDLAAVDAVMERLQMEMNGFQERNPIFTHQTDPLLELEYNLLMEIGVLALERTGDLEKLLQVVESSSIWEEVEEDIDGEAGELEEEEIDEDLESYVDEPAQMAAVALERLAIKTMPSLPPELLNRLAVVPDITLLDLENEDADPMILVDLAELRNRARKALEALS